VKLAIRATGDIALPQRLNNPKQPGAIEVAAGLIFRNGKLLITQRFNDSHCGGLWEFPGGKREPGETFEQCLARELNEELGIEAAVHELIKTIRHAGYMYTPEREALVVRDDKP